MSYYDDNDENSVLADDDNASFQPLFKLDRFACILKKSKLHIHFNIIHAR